MLAPNGARRTKADHPGLPITIDEIASDALAGHQAGAEAIHVHVRDKEGRHSLDTGLYRELLHELDTCVPEMQVQVTTESAGIYSPHEQRQLLKDLRPSYASVSIREFMSENDLMACRHAYQGAHDQGTTIQHILYDMGDVELLSHAIHEGIVHTSNFQILLVMGSYDGLNPPRLQSLDPMLAAMGDALPDADPAICCFGRLETAVLAIALTRGWNIRVGFENNLFSINGELAPSNASRVAEVLQLHDMINRRPGSEK